VNASVDVAIVGGGFAGAATAWALVRAGVGDVVVLERETELGRFASGRGAGLGRQLADDDDTTALTVRGARVLSGELHDCWLASGGVLGFDDPALAEVYAARAAAFEVDVAPIDRESIVQLWPIAGRLDIACGLAVHGDGIIDIKRLLSHYASSGARIELGTEVVAIEPGVVVTRTGRIAAKVIVDASGAWAGRLTGDAPLDAFKRHLFVVEASSPGEPYLWHLGRREVYLRRDGGGILASACDATRTSPEDLAVDPAARAALADLLGDVSVSREWACVRSFTANRRMRVGRDPSRPWLVWAVGLGGHGATASAAVGEAAARAAIDAL